MTSEADVVKFQWKKLRLYELGTYEILHTWIEQLVVWDPRWLDIPFALNASEDGAGFMAPNLRGPDKFHCFLKIDEHNRWNLPEESIAILGAMAERGPTIEMPAGSWSGPLYKMSQLAVDLTQAA